MLIEPEQVVRVQFGEQFLHFSGSEMTERWERFRAEDDGVGLVAAEVIDECDQPDVDFARTTSTHSIGGWFGFPVEDISMASVYF